MSEPPGSSEESLNVSKCKEPTSMLKESGDAPDGCRSSTFHLDSRSCGRGEGGGGGLMLRTTHKSNYRIWRGGAHCVTGTGTHTHTKGPGTPKVLRVSSRHSETRPTRGLLGSRARVCLVPVDLVDTSGGCGDMQDSRMQE